MPDFRIQATPLFIASRHPFTISRGSKQLMKNVLISFRNKGITGFGEAAPNARYNESDAAVEKDCNSLSFEALSEASEPEEAARLLDSLDFSTQSAKAGCEAAWLDWYGKYHNQPVWKLLNLPRAHTPSTSFTIGIDTIPVMIQKIREADEFPILKVKLGTRNDEEIIKALRQETSKIIRVDANEGWISLQQAMKNLEFLHRFNIEFVEQPMPKHMIKETEELRKRSPLPLCADESLSGDFSLGQLAQSFDIINIKLMKVGSILKGIKLQQEARKTGLKTMAGCMMESSLGIAAGCLPGVDADYVDLDGHLLLSNDPFSGLGLTEEKGIQLSDNPGLGVDFRIE